MDVKMEAKQTNRFFVLDFLNVICCMGVVWLHVNGAVWTFSYFRTWVTSWLLETLLYWPVPLFFMMTGIKLMDYRQFYGTKEFLKRRFVKTGIPFLFWSVVSVFWAIHVSGYLPPDTDLSVVSMLDLIFNCKGMVIYWFFPALFSVYLSMPFVSLIAKEKRRTAYTYVLAYGLLANSVLPFIAALLGKGMNAELKSPICGGYLVYVLFGYLLWDTWLSKRQRCVIYLAGIAGWAVRFFGGWYLSYQENAVNSTFSGYLNVPCILQSIAVFVFFKHADLTWLEKKMGYLIKQAASMSFGVYLIHFYIMRFLIDYFAIEMSSWQWRLTGVFLVYASSLCIVAMIKKIPVLTYLIGA